jgi:hypothetical protein
MFKNIDLDDIRHFLGWALVSGITLWMIVTYFRERHRNNKKYGKGWRKKLWDRYRDL